MREDNVICAIKRMIEEELKGAIDEGINHDNIDDIGKLIDIHKDIKNEEYWELKEEVYAMRDGGYGSKKMLPERETRTDADGKIHEVIGHYKHYVVASHAADMGDRRAEIECTNCLECMLEAVYDFICMLEENAGSPEEVQIIKKYRKKVGEM